ncbi:MAG: hypothetical protein KAI24_21055 [Planctomycetes bacterium]|nr:hypothetical protein [Planctomycetota bacterium]
MKRSAILAGLLLMACSAPRERAAPLEHVAPPQPAAQPDPARAVTIPPPSPGQRSHPWTRQRRAPTSRDQVTPARDLVPEITWPDAIDEPTRLLMQAVAGDLDADGGLRHVRAKRKLVEAGYPALFAIVECLRELDYLDPRDAMLGHELHQLLEQITGGLNARYAEVAADEVIHPAKAEWNGRTVKAWVAVLRKWPDEPSFERARQARTRR